MSSITFKNREIRVNGRYACEARKITRLEKIRAGVFAGVEQDQYPFTIDGGKAQGGTKNDWYLTSEVLTGGRPMKCSSLMDAIRTIENS